ncbi:aldehyde dehydrogenase family protein [Paraburkholderia saeva]|uniref:NAD/NADP-dependent betaine aldehyde dehydrogenase n=1 Tax=Paraburkholderia saeva TaxID=2777537 RepID=A0A9N8RSI1_9BURK|nr:aldehyde dehydrogenase family protein [Paraburkholderia saeva]CAG4886909.1 NAD/NADP-dependent betaine aldehyde dehydrogenase [Paraburkholderia saeva]CAG4887080.1 NAD/NADP-dependent betaine aldehyde dehydrogenase [Paraburkholderia saeva]
MFDAKTILEAAGVARVQSGAYVPHAGWTATQGRATFDVTCPADGETYARIAGATEAEYESIAQAAVAAQRKWRMVPAPRRGELVHRIGELIAQNMETLAAVVALDTGKSLMEARGELKECVDMATLAAGQSRMLFGFTQQSQRAKHRMYDQWLPLGVAAVISAYNFPAAVWAQNGFLAAIGGNTVIWKPSPKVPLTAIAIQNIANQAMKEMDCEGVFSLFIPESNEVAELIVTDPRIALVSFTGSSQVGRKVANIVGGTLGRRYMLECSGNNGCIVDETADLKLAARSITFGVVGTTGQRCTSTRRVIAHRSVVRELTELLKQSFAQIKVGDPREQDAVVGPLIDRAAVGDFANAITMARELGGNVVYGGKRIDRPGYYVEPTIVTGVQPQWQCVQHETFAPILYVMVYDDLEEALRIHNDVPQGLASGIHSMHLGNIELFLSAAGSDCGIAKVNMGTTGADVGAAFGGEKETGGGRTAGSDAWKGYMRRQSVCVNWGGQSPWDARIKL